MLSILINDVEMGTLGAQRRYRLGTLEIEKRWMVETASMEIVDRDNLTATAYRPQLRDPIAITQDGGVFLFGGWITRVDDSRALPPDEGATVTRIECRGHDLLATEAYVSEIFAPNTLLGVASYLVAKYLGPKGIIWTGPTSGGPATDTIIFDHQRCDEALTQLTTMYGWPWRIVGQGNAFLQDPNAIEPGLSSPLTAENCRVIRQLRWQRELLSQPTRVLLQTGGSETIVYVHPPFTGDGALTTFLLLVEPTEIPTQVIEGGAVVPIDGVTWSYDAAEHALIKDTPVGAGVSVQPADLTVELPAWIRVGGPFLPTGALDRAQLRETLVQATEIIALDQALVYAVGLLNRLTVPEQLATLQTYTPHWFPIIRADLGFPDRLLTGEFIVQAVSIRDEGLSDELEGLLYEVDVASGTLAHRDWTEYWRERKAGSAGGTAVIGAPAPASGPTVPSPPAPTVHLKPATIGATPHPSHPLAANLTHSWLCNENTVNRFVNGGSAGPDYDAIIDAEWNDPSSYQYVPAWDGSSSYDVSVTAPSWDSGVELGGTQGAGNVANIGTVWTWECLVTPKPGGTYYVQALLGRSNIPGFSSAISLDISQYVTPGNVRYNVDNTIWNYVAGTNTAYDWWVNGAGIHLPFETRVHLVATLSSDDWRTLRLYIDGQEVANGVAANEGEPGQNLQMIFDSILTNLAAVVHHMRIWAGRVLTPAEVPTLYADQYGVYYAP